MRHESVQAHNISLRMWIIRAAAAQSAVLHWTESSGLRNPVNATNGFLCVKIFIIRHNNSYSINLPKLKAMIYEMIMSVQQKYCLPSWNNYDYSEQLLFNRSYIICNAQTCLTCDTEWVLISIVVAVYINIVGVYDIKQTIKRTWKC